MVEVRKCAQKFAELRIGFAGLLRKGFQVR